MSKGLLFALMLACAWSCHRTASASDADVCYQHALRRYRASCLAASESRQADWPAAIDAIRSFVARYPDDSRCCNVRFYLGEALVQNGQLPQAKASYRAFLDQNQVANHPDAAKAHFRIGELAFLLGDRDTADSALREFCRQYPRDPCVRFALPFMAELAFERSDYEAAIQLADRQLAWKSPRPEAAHLLQARSYQAMSQFAAAREACHRITHCLSADVDVDLKAHLIVAQSFAAEHDWRTAAIAYQRLAGLRHEEAAGRRSQVSTEVAYRPVALLGAADCFVQLHQIQSARQLYATLLAEFPGTPYSQTASSALLTLAEGSTS